MIVETLFVVKTNRRYHSSRLSVVQKTWAKVVHLANQYIAQNDAKNVTQNVVPNSDAKSDDQNGAQNVAQNVAKNVDSNFGKNVIFASDLVHPEYSTTVLVSMT
jgi:Fringe-like